MAVIGGGPVGLAAAAHLVAAGETPLVLEAGDGVGASMWKWAHVQVFSPWEYNVDQVARRLLEASDWEMPDPDGYPTGGEIVERYLEPLAALPEIAPHVRLGARVVSVARQGYDKMKTAGREYAPFLLHVAHASGDEDYVLAKAVIDASGTWEAPNPMGSSGIPAIGERANADHIHYGIPDVHGKDRDRYAGKRVLVIGGGHSAFNSLNDLVALTAEASGTEIHWAFRRQISAQLFGGGESDQLRERGRLGAQVQASLDSGLVRPWPGFRTTRVSRGRGGIVVTGEDQVLPPVDEIIVATGFRPDLMMLSELRLDLDPAVESPTALAPLIDPNLHSCGTVRPHGADELTHPEIDFYIAGMKSYGRAPTFLMLTGYEQVRSIVAAIQGDWESARQVQLVLPETGVCTRGSSGSDGGCCAPMTDVTVLPVAGVVSCCGSPEPALAGGVRTARTCCG